MPIHTRALTGAGKAGGSGGGSDPRLPNPTDCGQILITLDGATWEAHKLVVGDQGPLANAQGDLLVEGWHANG